MKQCKKNSPARGYPRLKSRGFTPLALTRRIFRLNFRPKGRSFKLRRKLRNEIFKKKGKVKRLISGYSGDSSQTFGLLVPIGSVQHGFYGSVLAEPHPNFLMGNFGKSRMLKCQRPPFSYKYASEYLACEVHEQ